MSDKSTLVGIQVKTYNICDGRNDIAPQTFNLNIGWPPGRLHNQPYRLSSRLPAFYSISTSRSISGVSRGILLIGDKTCASENKAAAMFSGGHGHDWSM